MAPQPSVFARDMLDVTYESCFLWELPLPTTSRENGATVVVRGPWRPEDCAAVLLRWFDAGFVHCEACISGIDHTGAVVTYAYDPGWVSRAAILNGFYILAKEDARPVLADTTMWSHPGAASGVQVGVEAAIEDRADADWFGLLADLPLCWNDERPLISVSRFSQAVWSVPGLVVVPA